jgi:FtsP/CotA-like multicopper oxidase with cupredoxin domain
MPTETLPELPAAEPPPPRDSSTWPLIFATVAVLALAVVMSIAALVAADDGSSAAATGESAMVSEREFSIDPANVGVGGSLHVMNDGTVVHNLAVEDTDLKTSDLAVGASETLALSGLDAGSYTMFCTLPGHRESGMEAALTITEGGGSPTASPPASHDDTDYEAMTAAMLDTMAKFPAATEGSGNTILDPTEVKADGTKVFDLTAEITDWERAPGDVVQAWTYNGVVPAPSIHLEVGDKAEFRLTNKLPIGTDLHLHGLNVDNEFDGVAPITQDLIAPGETFTYEYTADEVSVAMYHPHFHSQIGLPNGMFGTVFVGQIAIPRGQTIGGEAIPADLQVAQEFPMVLNDSGVIGYSLNGKSFPATAPITAKQGDWVLFHYFNEGTQIHPMHLHQFDQIVLAKDGFPLDNPYVADVVTVAPGERYSVLVKLDKPGAWVWHCHILPHVEDENGMFGMVTAVIVE